MNIKNSFKVVRRPNKSKNYLATIAIGEKYYHQWKKYALPTWDEYCQNNDIGIIVITDDLINKKDPKWKNATWQKLLLGQTFIDNKLDIDNICYLDTDILANPLAPNIFDNYDENSIAVVSQRKNLEQPLDETLRRLAYLRHTHYNNDYPLDSALFMIPEEVYKYHGLEPKDDYFCAGLFVFNLLNHSSLMKSWFNKYTKDIDTITSTKDIDTITSGGDEPILNYEFLKYENITWLDYKFQALWIYEMPWKYSFLYSYGKNNNELIIKCIEESLTTNYFLHFAGSWYESDMWKLGNVFTDNAIKKELRYYHEYLKSKVTGKPKGSIKPTG